MINWKTVSDFLLDHLNFSISYFLNCFLILLFYRILVRNIEILYPAAISLFIYLIATVVSGIRYYNYNTRIRNLVSNPFYKLKGSTCEQKETAGLISDLHSMYIEKINTIELKNRNNNKFIAQWIHKLKTPVSVIDLVIQKSKAGDLLPEKAIRDISQENRSLLNSLEQVLNILRIEDFTIDYEPETVDLVEAVNKIINSMKNEFVYNNVFPKLQGNQSPMPVLTDRKWNEAVIVQLLSNAIKYSKQQNELKNIYFVFEQSPSATTLTIRDEGIGIPEYDLPKIFEPFFTGENGRKFENASGIGLYFCREVASRLGHKISIKSKVGVGTEVSVSYLSKL